MLNVRDSQRFAVIGGGTAGWIMALELQRILGPEAIVTVISAPEIPVVGVGEGGILNFMQALDRLKISLPEFMQATGAVHKLGFAYEKWRTNTADDIFYHMFPSLPPDLYPEVNGYFPALSVMHNHGLGISYISDGIAAAEANISQEDLTRYFLSGHKTNFNSSFHFDAYRVGAFLRQIALHRGVIHAEDTVMDVSLDSQTGMVTQLLLSKGSSQSVDFVIDATGFARTLIQKKLGIPWHSLSDILIMDRAIPFHLSHPRENPDLVTRATALSSGWVWQIPLQKRVGAGYVFSSQYLSDDKAVAELESWQGRPIDPIRTIQFEAGYFEKVWQGNVMAIGLASGFVEPLEATSIGQTIHQIELFCNVLVENGFVVPPKTIDFFNLQHRQAWNGIGDFVRMHYDTSRNDSAFWKDIKRGKLSEKYLELKSLWKLRTPRKWDFVDYEMDASSQFGVYSWLTVGQGVGIIPPEATVPELLALTPEQRHMLALNLAKRKKELKVT